MSDAPQQDSLPVATILRRKKGTARSETPVFAWLCLCSAWMSVLVLGMFLVVVTYQAAGSLNWSFLTSYDSKHNPEAAGILAGIWGTFWTISLMMLISVPVGVGAGLYLEEYAADTWLTRVIRINLANLAGVPSIVYGILGLSVFVRMFGLLGQSREFMASFLFLSIPVRLPFDRTVISAALTLSLLVLPVMIVATQEALRAVPASIRHASLALGATQWQTVSRQVLPAAAPGILTGIILSVSRAIGETAPLIVLGAFAFILNTPGNIESLGDIVRNPSSVLQVPFSYFTAIPIQIYNWVSDAKNEYRGAAAAAILVLLMLLLAMNGLAIYIRNHYQKKLKW